MADEKPKEKKQRSPNLGGARPGSGRKKRNNPVNGARAFEICESLKFDPLIEMIEVQKAAKAEGDLHLAGKMASDICRYVHPALRSMELSGKGGKAIDHKVSVNVVGVAVDKGRHDDGTSSGL